MSRISLNSAPSSFTLLLNMIQLQDKIKDVYQQARASQWSYPQLFHALKAAGVRSYETDVLNFQITYFGDGEKLSESGPAGWKLDAGPFNEAEVVKAIRRAQRRETDYPTFLKEIAAAGIPKYYVSMSEDTVSYVGADPKNKYVEKVPGVSK